MRLMLICIASAALAVSAESLKPHQEEVDTGIDSMWQWFLSLNIKSVFFYVNRGDNQCPIFKFSDASNNGNNWVVPNGYLNGSRSITAIVETTQKQAIAKSIVFDSTGRMQTDPKKISKRSRDTWSSCAQLRKNPNTCFSTFSKLNGYPVDCSGKIMFSESFSNTSNWLHVVEAQHLEPVFESVSFVNSSENVYSADNKLYFTITKAPDNETHLPDCTYKSKLPKKSISKCGKIPPSKSRRKNNLRKKWPLFQSAKLKSKCRIETKVELETESRLTKKIRSGEIIFEDDFNGNQIDKGKWTHEERNLNTDTYDNQFVAFTAHNNYSRVENNKLKLTIIKLSIRKNHVFNNCTSTNKDPKIYAKECGKPKKNDSRIKRRVFPESDINGSGNIHTKGKFSFKYGRVEIRAKMPRGEFLFPNIFLQPVKYDVDYPMVPQIRLYARGNTVLQDVNRLDLSGKSLFGSVLIWKQEKEKRNYVPYEAFVTRTSPYHYSEDFYNYTIVWRKEKIVYMVDGVVVGTIANSQMLEDFNLHECYLVLGLIAGGRTNFDDDNIMEYHKRKIFSNEARGAKSGFYKAMKTFSWDQPSLLVDYIRVYAIDKNGY